MEIKEAHNCKCYLEKDKKECPYCCRHIFWETYPSDNYTLSDELYCGSAKGSDTPDGSSAVSKLKRCPIEKKEDLKKEIKKPIKKYSGRGAKGTRMKWR